MPFDVGKTRTQVFRDSNSSSTTAKATSVTSTTARSVEQGTAAAAAAPEERNMARLLWHIFRTEGVPGLFRGWIPRTLRVAPACAIMISSYEVGKRVFRGVNERALLAERRKGGEEP
jgi:solute carrier family 25 protein 39/40